MLLHQDWESTTEYLSAFKSRQPLYYSCLLSANFDPSTQATKTPLGNTSNCTGHELIVKDTTCGTENLTQVHIPRLEQPVCANSVLPQLRNNYSVKRDRNPAGISFPLSVSIYLLSGPLILSDTAEHCVTPFLLRPCPGTTVCTFLISLFVRMLEQTAIEDEKQILRIWHTFSSAQKQQLSCAWHFRFVGWLKVVWKFSTVTTHATTQISSCQQ